MLIEQAECRWSSAESQGNFCAWGQPFRLIKNVRVNVGDDVERSAPFRPLPAFQQMFAFMSFSIESSSIYFQEVNILSCPSRMLWAPHTSRLPGVLSFSLLLEMSV